MIRADGQVAAQNSSNTASSFQYRQHIGKFNANSLQSTTSFKSLGTLGRNQTQQIDCFSSYMGGHSSQGYQPSSVCRTNNGQMQIVDDFSAVDSEAN